jgi:hypothetical protein
VYRTAATELRARIRDWLARLTLTFGTGPLVDIEGLIKGANHYYIGILTSRIDIGVPGVSTSQSANHVISFLQITNKQ